MDALGWMRETLEGALGMSGYYKAALICVGIVLAVYWYATWTHDFFTKRGVPGPKPGLLGCMLDFWTTGIKDFDVHLVKTYGPVVGTFHARSPVYLISDPEMIKEITVKKFSSFVNRSNNTMPRDPLFRSALTSVKDDHWRFIRSTLSPTFTSGRMRGMVPLVQRCVEHLVRNLDKLSEDKEKSIEMKKLFSQFTMDVIAATAFGLEVNCQENPDNDFTKNAEKIMKPTTKIYTIFIVCTLFPFLSPLLEKVGISLINKSVSDFFTRTVHSAIETRQADEAAQRDFLQLMLNSQKLEDDQDDKTSDSYLEFDKSKRRGLTKDEIVSNAILFLLAGNDTTAQTLTWMSYLLATNPECQDKLIDEIDTVIKGEKPDYNNVLQLQYLENCVLETLRMFPLAVRVSRVAGEDVEIHGYEVKKGMEVHIPVAVIHKDPHIYENPETFEPDRFLPENRSDMFNYTFLGFGAGPRNCIGMRLAHMQAKMAMVGILQKYKFTTGPDTEIPPVQEKMNPARAKNGVHLRVVKRSEV